MKRFYPRLKRTGLFLSLIASLALLYAADPKIPNVTVTVSDFTLDYAPDGKTVTLMPASGGSTFSGTSDSDGVVNFLRVTPGQYTLTISGIGLDPLTLQVPNSTNDISASNLVISAWTPPSGARYAGATDNLRDLSRRLSIVDDALLLDGAAVGGGDTVWTNEGNQIHPSYSGGTTTNVVSSKLLVHGATYSNAGDFINYSTNADSLGWAYYSDVAIGVFGEASGGGGTVNAGANVGVYGYGGNRGNVNAGAVGFAESTRNGQTNIGVVATAALEGNSGVLVGLYAEVDDPGYGDDPQLESAVLLLDNRASAVPLIAACTNNGTTVFSVAASGLASSVAGFKSTDTTVAVSIATTGWTNTFGKNAVVYYDGTAVTAIVKNNAGT